MKRLSTILALAALIAVGAIHWAEPAAAAEKKPYKSKKERPRPTFDRCDADKDGVLSISEFAACYPRLGEERFHAIDTDKDGKVTREEMKAFENQHRMERKRAAFGQCDTDKDGVLSITEFAACYPRLSEESFNSIDTDKDGKVTREEMKTYKNQHKMERKRAFFDQCDTNKDGKLDFEEFDACKPEPPKTKKRQ